MIGSFLIDVTQREPFGLNAQKLATLPNNEPLYYTASVALDFVGFCGF